LESIIRNVRNKYGGHVDEMSPTWLKELRYLPLANCDVVTFLLWACGESLFHSICFELAKNRLWGSVVRPSTRYLGGICLSEAYVLQDASGLDMIASIERENSPPLKAQPLVGARESHIFLASPETTVSVSCGVELIRHLEI
jgi:hypothetical protein